MQKLQVKNPEIIKDEIHKYLNKSDEAKFVHRLHGILLLISNTENNCDTVAELFDNSPRSLSNWIHKINETKDINVLRDKAKPGRTPSLNPEQFEKLKQVLQKYPDEVGLNANIWDGKTLSYYIEREFKIILKVRQCQRIFRKLGFSLKRARPVVAKGDEQKKVEAKKNLKK